MILQLSSTTINSVLLLLLSYDSGSNCVKQRIVRTFAGSREGKRRHNVIAGLKSLGADELLDGRSRYS